MGAVFRARDAKLGRSVAVKVLASRPGGNALARFEREARTVAALRHPGIVTLLDVGEEGGAPYLVMELVEGESLAAAIRRGLAPWDAARIVRQVAEALAHAHAAGVVHRDVTPGNVLLDRDGRARLTDFGVARSDGLEGDAARLSKTGALVGTPSYIAPEVLAGGAATARSDIYALGVVLYEALTGELPHTGESMLQLVDHVLTVTPPAPRSIAPQVPETLSAICMKALARDPARRYASAQDLAQDLGRAAEGPRPGFLRNLAANRLRTAFALLGLAGSTASVLVLVSLALGARRVATSVFEGTPGIFVMKLDSLPYVSRIPASLEEKIRSVPGVAAVDPEVWAVAFEIEHRPAILEAVSAPTLVGIDPAKHARLRGGGLYARTLVQGRVLAPGDANGALISQRVARAYGKEPGGTINVLDRDFVVRGIFATGSPLFDGIIVAPANAVREIAEMRSSTVSCFFVEVAPGEDRKEVAWKRIHGAVGDPFECGPTEDWTQGGLDFVSGFDAFVAFFGVAVGLLGALAAGNALVFSVRERAPELALLGGTAGRGAVFRTVIADALLLGAVGSAGGVLLGVLGALLASALLPVTPTTPAPLLAGCFAFGTLLGAVGGLYPAIAACRPRPVPAASVGRREGVE
jgi:ABC-type antimicrobial peptide transport system permease subunit